MSPTDLARAIAIKRGIASLLVKRRTQLAHDYKTQHDIGRKIGALLRQADVMQMKLDKLMVEDD